MKHRALQTVVMDVSDVVASGSPGTGTVHGMVVGQVSPVKTSSKRSEVKYFDGQFSDDVLKPPHLTCPSPRGQPCKRMRNNIIITFQLLHL